ncbi:hypothetical protein Tco_1361665 [Tanacetum coccineum]
MITTTPLPPPPQQQSSTESELAEHVTALEKKLSDLEQTNKNLDNTTQNLGSRVYTLELRDLSHKINEAVRENVKDARMFKTGSYKSLSENIALYEARKASMERAQRDEFLAEKDKSRKRRRDDQDPPPPLPDSDQKDTDTSHLPKTKQRLEWLKPIPDDERLATLEPAWVIPTSYIPDAVNNWANALATTYQALVENSLLEKTRDMQTFMNWYCQKIGKTELTQADLEGQAYEFVKPFHSDVVHLQFQMEKCHKMITDQIDWANPEGDQARIDISKPLPLSGPPGHVTIQTQFFFNKDLDYLRYGSKGSRQALSISKIKVARYYDFGLELLVLEHMWIDDVCTYDISTSNAYSRYGYDYLKEITLRRADHQEYMIDEKDFKNLYPSNFEDLNMLLLQGHLNHLPGSDIRFEFKHDYTIIDSPRAVVFPIINNERKIMRFNEIYKFSDGTLTNIMEALDYRVKSTRNSYMPLNGDSRPEGSSRIWNALLVDGFTILTTDFFREWNDYFIPFIRSVLTGSGGSSKDGGTPIPRSVEFYFRTTCSYSTSSNDLMKAQVYVSKLPQL